MAARKSRRRSNVVDFEEVTPHHVHFTPKDLKPLTPAQGRHFQSLKSQTCVFAVGPAGTGKTYVNAAYAAQELAQGHIERIILTRPAVEAGESLGFLKGTLEEKFLPYLAPYVGVFRERMGRSFYEACLKNEVIQPVPLAYMQGMTFKNAIVLLDEAENTSPRLMKLVLTRLGEDCRIFISGDLAQQYSQGESGLGDAMGKLARVPGVAVIRYTVADVVRSDFQRRVLEAYDEPSGVGTIFG